MTVLILSSSTTGITYTERQKKLITTAQFTLPRTPCDKFFYDFPCNFLGIVGGYGLRHMCSHCLRALCDFFYGALGATRGKSVQRLCGDCTEIVQWQCSCRAVSAASARKLYGARAGSAFARQTHRKPNVNQALATLTKIHLIKSNHIWTQTSYSTPQ